MDSSGPVDETPARSRRRRTRWRVLSVVLAAAAAVGVMLFTVGCQPSEPQAVSAAQPSGQGGSEAAPEATDEARPQTDTAQTGTDAERQTQPAADATGQTEPPPEPDASTAEAEPEPAVENQTETTPEAETTIEPETDPEPDTAEAQSEPEKADEPETTEEAETTVDPEDDPQPDTSTTPEPEEVDDPETTPEAEITVEPEVTPEPDKAAGTQCSVVHDIDTLFLVGKTWDAVCDKLPPDTRHLCDDVVNAGNRIYITLELVVCGDLDCIDQLNFALGGNDDRASWYSVCTVGWPDISSPTPACPVGYVFVWSRYDWAPFGLIATCASATGDHWSQVNWLEE